MPNDDRHLIAGNETIGTHNRELHDGVESRMVRYETGRSLRTCLLCLFCVLFLDRKPCFFACAFFVKTICFLEVFFGRKSWGGRGGGRILGCALTPRWLELDLRCCMAKRTPKKKVKRLAADKQEAKGCARAAALFFSGIAPRQWKRDTAVRPRHMAAARFASGTGAGCFRLKTNCASAVCHKRKLVQLAV